MMFEILMTVALILVLVVPLLLISALNKADIAAKNVLEEMALPSWLKETKEKCRLHTGLQAPVISGFNQTVCICNEKKMQWPPPPI